MACFDQLNGCETVLLWAFTAPGDGVYAGLAGGDDFGGLNAAWVDADHLAKHIART